jgi:hypothetical protein
MDCSRQECHHSDPQIGAYDRRSTKRELIDSEPSVAGRATPPGEVEQERKSRNAIVWVDDVERDIGYPMRSEKIKYDGQEDRRNIALYRHCRVEQIGRFDCRHAVHRSTGHWSGVGSPVTPGRREQWHRVFDPVVVLGCNFASIGCVLG